MNQLAAKIKPQNSAVYLVPLAFITICLFMQGVVGQDLSKLQVAATLDGEYWRMVTAHLIHADWQHFLMNMTGLSLCVAVFYKDLAVRHWPMSFIALSIFSSIGLLILYRPEESYVGFSDVLHGWIMLGCCAIFAKETKLALIVFTLFWIKIIEEQLNLPFFTSTGIDNAHIAKESHILGAIAGLLYGLLCLQDFRNKLFSPFKKS